MGKTALICGLIQALPEYGWTAVKVTDHVHEGLPAMYEEETPGDRTDAARYLKAGARRAFLLAAEDDELALGIEELREKLDEGAHLLFESNRVLQFVRPDVALAVDNGAGAASFSLVLYGADALVVHAQRDATLADERPVFELAAFEHISAEMCAWLRKKLR